ncbi:MAG: 1,4-dihydroxy-2-naphthoate octaprenyltransferase [Chlamydiae bacterium RIFCSPHIGHO2_12_FULL_49_9]|nr:MAG: 1,4-dihydroxy-2-naphthoate octaprenyltransferase [Chlamydiae bacterium RIFCSPHIGHO2_12_FULL_49_9]
MHSTKSASPTSANSPGVLKIYFLASRPKTWIAGASPVLIGGAIAFKERTFSPGLFLLTLLFSLFIQIGTNYANDYFDFVKGADSPKRIGPKRATLEGWVKPLHMLRASFFAFGAAFLVAIPQIFVAGAWSLPFVLLCISLGILYTGGPKPLGYLGLGDLFVFLFFGPIPVLGAYYLQTCHLNYSVFIASLAPALLSCAILAANNIRDEKSDRQANKKTLVVRFGRFFGATEYSLCIAMAAMVPWILIGFFKAPLELVAASLIFPLSLPLIKKAYQSQNPEELISLLPKTAFLLLLYTALFVVLWYTAPTQVV